MGGGRAGRKPGGGRSMGGIGGGRMWGIPGGGGGILIPTGRKLGLFINQFIVKISQVLREGNLTEITKATGNKRLNDIFLCFIEDIYTILQESLSFVTYCKIEINLASLIFDGFNHKS